MGSRSLVVIVGERRGPRVVEGLAGVGVTRGDDLHDGTLEVTDLYVRRDFEHDVIAVHRDHRRVHPGGGADPGTGGDGVLLLGGLLLAAPLRPDHQKVEPDKDEHDQDRERQRA